MRQQTAGIGSEAALPRVPRASQFVLVPWAGVLVALVAVSAAISFVSPYFLTASNILGNVAVYFSWICIAGFGEAIVMIGGGLDLAVGSTMGLAGVIAALVLSAGGGTVIAIAAGLGGGPGGRRDQRVRRHAHPAQPVHRDAGLAQHRARADVRHGFRRRCHTARRCRRPGFPALGTATIWLVPVPVLIMLAIGILLTVLMNQTAFGRHVYAVGGKLGRGPAAGAEGRAREGRDVPAVRAAGRARRGAADRQGGDRAARCGHRLRVAGDRRGDHRRHQPVWWARHHSGRAGGAALLGVINNGIVLLGLAGYWQELITGLVIGAAATLDVVRQRLEAVLEAPGRDKDQEISNKLPAVVRCRRGSIGGQSGLSVRCPRAKLSIAVIPKALDNPVFYYAHYGADLRAKELGDVDVVWTASSTSDANQEAQILAGLIARHVNGMAVDANAPQPLVAPIAQAVAQGMKVITWDSDVPDSKRQLFYGVDSVGMGRRWPNRR